MVTVQKKLTNVNFFLFINGFSNDCLSKEVQLTFWRMKYTVLGDDVNNKKGEMYSASHITEVHYTPLSNLPSDS